MKIRISPRVRRWARRYGLLTVLVPALISLVVVLATLSLGGDGSEIESALPGAGEAPEAVELTQNDAGAGGVTIEVTWMTADELRAEEQTPDGAHDLSEKLLFRVKMETETVDLSQYDLTIISLLRDDEGREFAPQAWEGWEESKYHREGLLVFQRPPTTGGVDIIILGLAGTAQRIFRWEAVPSE